MKERPILFSAAMVRAILSGAKTQTRRVVKSIEGIGGIRLVPLVGKREAIYLDHEIPGLGWRPFGGSTTVPWPTERLGEVCPYGAPGDRLWVRETWADATRVYPHDRVAYRADRIWAENIVRMEDVRKEDASFRWKPSIHMPRWASRITLEVTGVRVERLGAISDEDGRAEGYSNAADFLSGDWAQGVLAGAAWAQAPWVWAISFRRVEAKSEAA